MDPISLLIRSLSLSIYPLFNFIIRAFFDTVYDIAPSGVVEISETLYSGFKQQVLSFNQPYFHQALFIGMIFFAVLGMNLYEKRFWCRNLCPLGALLGLLSRFAILQRYVSEGCNECGACAGVCQGNASPDEKDAWRKDECLYCWNCDDICPNNAVHFGFRKSRSQYPFSNDKYPGVSLGRRGLIVSMLSGIAAVPLFRTTPLLYAGSLTPDLIRPPGALEESEFLKRCIKCGECMKVCITNGLQPTLMEAGLEGLWSPVLVPRLGYCEYRCTLCGQVCPTGAIQELSIKKKVDIKIGLAMIDRNRCLPHAHATPCIVCEEVCPTPKKAVWLEKATVKNRRGDEINVQQPVVDLKLCIGCGICEAKCPVKGRPAIYVTNTGESRSEKNSLLLT
jgi:ferredoxin